LWWNCHKMHSNHKCQHSCKVLNWIDQKSEFWNCFQVIQGEICAKTFEKDHKLKLKSKGTQSQLYGWHCWQPNLFYTLTHQDPAYNEAKNSSIAKPNKHDMSE
jgi:hypothetical protein